VRCATLTDAAGIARVQVQSWRATYPGILPATEIERHTLARRARMWIRVLQAPAPGLFVAVAADEAGADEVRGFASTGAFRVEPAGGEGQGEGQSEGQGDGELNALYVLPGAQRQGTGRRLFDAGANALREAGFHAMRCWVLHGNPAIAFYERLGGARVASKTFTVDGVAVDEHCYRFELG
jgi:ribosomal protein S18 acetylase RimI-like enzyme